MRQKNNFATDIDGTFVWNVPHFADFVSHKTGKRVFSEQVVGYSFTVWGFSQKEIDELLLEFNNSEEELARLAIKDGANDVLKAWKLQHVGSEVHAITFRDGSGTSGRVTREFIAPTEIDEVFFCTFTDLMGGGRTRSKSEIIDEGNYTVFVEDKFATAVEVALNHPDLLVLLMNKRWNERQYDKPHNVVRVFDWMHVGELLRL